MTALIYDDAEQPTDEVIRAFHHVFAITSIANGVQKKLREKDGGHAVVYSNTFDIYPMFPFREDPDWLRADAVAVRNLDESAKFPWSTFSGDDESLHPSARAGPDVVDETA